MFVREKAIETLVKFFLWHLLWILNELMHSERLLSINLGMYKGITGATYHFICTFRSILFCFSFVKINEMHLNNFLSFVKILKFWRFKKTNAVSLRHTRLFNNNNHVYVKHFLYCLDFSSPYWVSNECFKYSQKRSMWPSELRTVAAPDKCCTTLRVEVCIEKLNLVYPCA